MIISMYIGAHGTNGTELMQTLKRNRDLLSQHHVQVPNPDLYRDLLPDVMRKVGDEKADTRTQEMLIDQLTDGQPTNRIVMSFENLICMPALIFDKDAFYGKADFKLQWLRNVFADSRMEFYFGIRNPATFVPKAYSMLGRNTTLEQFIGDMKLNQILWAPLIESMKFNCTDAAFTFYVYEDTPVTWGQLLHEMTGIESHIPMAGELDMIAPVMQREGLARLRTYLETHQPRTESQRKKILSAFLEKYVDDTAMEEDIDFPGWTQSIVDALTDQYEKDLDAVERIQGVRLITL